MERAKRRCLLGASGCSLSVIPCGCQRRDLAASFRTNRTIDQQYMKDRPEEEIDIAASTSASIDGYCRPWTSKQLYIFFLHRCKQYVLSNLLKVNWKPWVAPNLVLQPKCSVSHLFSLRLPALLLWELLLQLSNTAVQYRRTILRWLKSSPAQLFLAITSLSNLK